MGCYWNAGLNMSSAVFFGLLWFWRSCFSGFICLFLLLLHYLSIPLGNKEKEINHLNSQNILSLKGTVQINCRTMYFLSCISGSVHTILNTGLTDSAGFPFYYICPEPNGTASFKKCFTVLLLDFFKKKVLSITTHAPFVAQLIFMDKRGQLYYH